MSMLISKPLRFGYINAKCRALKSAILEKEFFEKAVLAKSIGDIYALLKDSSYSSYLKDAEKENIASALENSFEELYKKSTSVLKKEEKEIFDLFFRSKDELLKKKTAFKESKNLSVIYRRIDTKYINSIKNSLKNLKREDRKDLKEILGSYFDMLNLFTIVRFRTVYKMAPEEIIPFLMPYGWKFDIKFLGKVANLSTLSEISAAIEEVLKNSFYSYHEFRQAVYRYHMDSLKRVWFGYPFKMSVIFALLRMKEIEIKNIRAVVEGIYYRLPQDDIKKLLAGI
ncbi:V-type ATPase subunit [Nitrosophilus alvini]|uniref:V-type ATPase subunit n=1 Tax=Nitrosophilus alvini TaxID=2714855 RepID=UPI00190AD79A|nr:V-type ATPase subunit [Nitrosophilus alvini]